MRAPLSWLKEYLTLDLPAEKIADTLTLAGLEVEKTEILEPSFEGVVVGKILSIAPHPNADRLRILTVFDGKEQFQVVCGDLTCKEGQKSAFARIGATLTEEGKKFKIKKSKLRDVESFGMMCSEKELGLPETRDGIMDILDLPEGTDLASLYKDVIFEVALTPNLGHALSIKGVARELAAQLQLPLKKPEFSLQEGTQSLDSFIKVEIQDKEKCKEYNCRLIQNVQIGPSPDWLKRRLEACGVRSINNIVDVTNYIMLELGQPLHAFDYDTLEGKKIILTSNTSQSSLITLDEKERKIPKDCLLICDEKKALAFAGVMGGLHSSVTEKTKNVLIESANFTAEAVRKSSKLLQLRTEGSQRWERGVDRLGAVPALDRAAALSQEVAGGSIAKGIMTEISTPYEPRRITLRLNRVNKILGVHLSEGEISSLLERLDVTAEKGKGEGITYLIPSYRNDLQIEIDLIEEIGRLYGFNKIGKKISKHVSSPLDHAPIFLFENEVKGRLIAEGLQEFLTCDLISPSLAELTKESSLSSSSFIKVLSPSSEDNSVLRTTLLPGLLQAVKFNIDHQNPNIWAFEVGRVHFKENEKYEEPSLAGIILTGKTSPYHFDPKPRDTDFFDLKGIVENLMEALGISKPVFEISHLHNFHTRRQARIKIDDTYLGAIGEVHPSHLLTLGIEQRVFFAEINLQDLIGFRKKEKKVEEVPSFPISERDWTLALKEETPLSEVLHAIENVKSPILEKVLLLDVYTSEKLGKDRKNVTFRFTFREKGKTISFETVEGEHNKITQEVAKKLANRLL